MKITLCGSYAFHGQMAEIAHSLEAEGHDVRYPRLDVTVPMPDGTKAESIAEYIKLRGGIDALPTDDLVWGEKGKAIGDHFAKIAWADAILVVNGEKKGIPGYVGGNTLMEVGLARYFGKRLFILERPSSQLSYVEEILGCGPVILEGDISKITTP